MPLARTLKADNGKQFVSVEFENFCRAYDNIDKKQIAKSSDRIDCYLNDYNCIRIGNKVYY